MPKLWLPPAVWFHGSQQQSVGGSSARNAITVRIISCFEQSIRCVLMTPFGFPVDPEVNRIFAMVSGPTRFLASLTDAVPDVARSSLNGVDARVAGDDDETTSSTPAGS